MLQLDAKSNQLISNCGQWKLYFRIPRSILECDIRNNVANILMTFYDVTDNVTNNFGKWSMGGTNRPSYSPDPYTSNL